MKAVIVLCMFLSVAFAHDWLMTPVPHNGGSAQNAAPCDPITPTSAVTNIVKGQDLDVSWGNGHKSGTHVLGIAKFGEDTKTTDFTQLASVAADQDNQPQHYTLKADTFAKYNLGDKLTLRWSWSGYDNCATLVMSAPAPDGAVAPPATTTTNPVTNKPIVAGDMLLTANNKTIGTFNIYTGSLICASGYHASGNKCVAGEADAAGTGLSGAAQFFIAFFVIVVVGVAAFAGFSYYKHGDALHYVRRNKKDQSSNYMAYQDQRV